MKGKLFGKKGPQPTVENAQAYPPQHALSPDPRSNPPPIQYQQRIDPNQQPIPQPQDSQPSHLSHTPSKRRSSQQQTPEQQQQHQHHTSVGYIPPRQQGIDEPHQRQQDYRHSAYLLGASGGQAPPRGQAPQHEEKERRGLRDRLFGTSKENKGEPSNSGVGRTLSRRGKQSPNPEAAGQPWARQQQNNSSQLLLSPTEEDEDAPHNRIYGQQPHFVRAPQPHQEGQLEQAYSPNPAQQEYYPPPGSAQQIPQGQFPQPGYRNQGSSEQVYISPEQQLQLQQQGQFVRHPDQHLQQAPPQQQFQHYPPPSSQGSAAASGQSHPATAPPAYPYSPAEQHSPDEAPGQGQFPPQVKVAEGQPQQLEILQPQATRPAQGEQEGAFLQAPQGHGPPSPFPNQSQQSDQPATTNPQQPPSPVAYQASIPSPMPPPSRSGGQSRQDGKGMHSSSRESSMTAQHPGGQSSGVQSFPANVVPVGSQGQPYRGQTQQESDLGKGSPSTSSLGEITEEEIAHYHQLKSEHKELKEKYQKVKKYYFEKESQVHQLQNTLANQRLSASKTSLDDSEYAARFSRLDGLISQLAFSIRKSWTSIPPWLHPAVNKDAIQTGKQEMTAVGRAFISRWLFLEVFECIFHPDLELGLSFTLKRIVNNLRLFAPPCNSAEEEEALSSKLAAWRMATIEGLSDQLRSPAAQENRQELLRRLNTKLIADISAFLVDPAPPDLAGGVYMITELATNIASHLPQESREVSIECYLPMYPVVQEVMKLESGIPQLLNPIAGGPLEDDADSAKDTATTGASDAGSKDDEAAPPPPPHKDEHPKGRRNMLASFMNPKQGSGAPPQPQQPGHKSGASQSNVAAPAQASGKANGTSGRDTPSQLGKQEVVRMAVGLGVVIRNRSVLVKAPVFTTLV